MRWMMGKWAGKMDAKWREERAIGYCIGREIIVIIHSLGIIRIACCWLLDENNCTIGLPKATDRTPAS
jgi:hypothetical protein